LSASVATPPPPLLVDVAVQKYLHTTYAGAYWSDG